MKIFPAIDIKDKNVLVIASGGNVDKDILKSSPYIYDKALALGMTDPDIDDE